MDDSCRNMLKIKAPALWYIAIINIVKSCIILLIPILFICAITINYYRLGLLRRNNSHLLQIQEQINNFDPENSQII